MEIRKFRSVSVNETHALASSLAKHLRGGDVLGLNGDLGSGKTTFVQGLAKALEVDARYLVTSPTFSLVQEYPSAKGMLYHMDFYRLEGVQDAGTLGLDQYFHEQGISVIEWVDRAMAVIPQDFLEIQFVWCSENEREMIVVPHGPRAYNIAKIL